MLKKIDNATLLSWVGELMKKMPVAGVVARNDKFDFEFLNQPSELRLDYDVTVLPPKRFFQPPRETLLEFDTEKGYRSAIESGQFVLFGVHPYDVEAISQMDAIFAMDKCDAHYIRRREKATIVAVDVYNSSPYVFASCMGTAVAKTGFDILLTRVGDDYIVDVRTNKGKAAAGFLARTPDADAVSLARREQLWDDNRRLLRKFFLKVPPAELPALLARSYDHPVWERRAELCFSCGSCNLVCPTCYCFDVRDRVGWDLKSGVRERMWDGCLLKAFAVVAGGHNFRKSRSDRYRHRYYRKGKYIPEKINRISCVGCGRCISACVSKIANPVEVYNSLLEVEQ